VLVVGDVVESGGEIAGSQAAENNEFIILNKII